MGRMFYPIDIGGIGNDNFGGFDIRGHLIGKNGVDGIKWLKKETFCI